MSCRDEGRGQCKEERCNNRKRTSAGWGAAGAAVGAVLGGPVGAVIGGLAGAAIGDEAAQNECHEKRKKSS